MGLGGGTIVRHDGEADGGGVTVGPDSVGYRVISDAMCMGGPHADTLRCVAGGGAAGRVRRSIAAERCGEQDLPGRDRLGRRADRGAGRANEGIQHTAAADGRGGGAHLVPAELAGFSEVVWPPHHSVANAFGAAIAEAAGSIDKVYSYDATSRDDCLRSAREEATDAAIRAGANAGEVRITSVVEIPMTYVPGGGCRVIVKAVGPLAA